jgi:hypothetical protein
MRRAWKTKTTNFFVTIVLRIRMFLGLLDPDPLVRGTDQDKALDKDPFSSRKNSKKNLDSNCFVTFYLKKMMQI